MITVFGLKTCDTCWETRRYLDERDFVHEFRDLRTDGFSGDELDQWLTAAGWEKLLNKSSTTWRGLADEDKQDLDETKARGLLLANPTLIKRPVINTGRPPETPTITVGFDKDVRDTLRSLF
jgi:arsenate reductase